jgi:hypothetical protein
MRAHARTRVHAQIHTRIRDGDAVQKVPFRVLILGILQVRLCGLLVWCVWVIPILPQHAFGELYCV